MRLRRLLRYRRPRSSPSLRSPQTGLSTARPRVAVYVSSHGYGHAIRVGEVCRCLAERRLAAGRDVEFVVVAPHDPALWPEVLEARSTWVAEPTDTGVVQLGDLHVDQGETAAALARWRDRAPEVLGRERDRLAAGSFSLVLADVPPLAVEAAEAAGLPCVAVANFSWDWIYEAMGFAADGARAAEAYARAACLLVAEPDAPMPAFGTCRRLGVVGRRPTRTPPQIRRSLNVTDSTRLVLLSFRDPWDLLSLPPEQEGVVYLSPRGPLPEGGGRGDVLVPPGGSDYLDLLVAADLVVGKPGYATIGDVEANGLRMLYVGREGFPEDAVLEAWLERRSATASVTAEQLSFGEWGAVMSGLLNEQPPPQHEADGALKAASFLDGLLGG